MGMETAGQGASEGEKPSLLQSIFGHTGIERAPSYGGANGEMNKPQGELPKGYHDDLPYMDDEIAGLLRSGMQTPVDEWNGGEVPHPFRAAQMLSRARAENPEATIFF